MTDEKIIEYVMDSPENTNPSVLDSMLKSNKVQPDWNQNNSTANDYIKNRPFYEEVTEFVMLPETSFECVSVPSEIIISNSFPYTFEVGKEYTVTLDGVKNTYTAIINGGRGVLTNTSLKDVMAGNGWVILVDTGACGLTTMDSSLVGAHAISISSTITNIHKIDDIYIDADFKMDKTNPVGEGSFSLNRKANTDIGNYSFAEGYNTTASGMYSHAEGWNTIASDMSSHAEGGTTTASSEYSHAEGSTTTASGFCSHAEGSETTASGSYSHVEGHGTIAASYEQHVQGRWNVEDSNDVYAHIVGGGISNDKRKNIHTVDWNGNAWYDGNIEGKALIIASSTAGSTKRFKVTVDDTGTLTATEVTS